MTEVLSDQKHAAAAERAVENSDAFKLQQLTYGVALNVYSETPPDLAAEITSRKSELKQIREESADWVASVRDAVRLSSSDDVENFQTVLTALEAKQNSLPLLKRLIDWFVGVGDLAQRHVDALRSIAAKRSGEAEAVVTSVKTDLEKIGSGRESMIANAHEAPDAAERQFDFIARQNVRSRAAIQKAQQATVEVDAAAETVKQIPGRLETARQILRRIAIDAVASAT